VANELCLDTVLVVEGIVLAFVIPVLIRVVERLSLLTV
jgi:hypothetical protein